MTANAKFTDAYMEFDKLIDQLRALRDKDFNARGRNADYGDVGSVRLVNAKLREALAHYDMAAE